jgi:hypothetical protein
VITSHKVGNSVRTLRVLGAANDTPEVCDDQRVDYALAQANIGRLTVPA